MDSYEKNILTSGTQLDPKNLYARRLENLKGTHPDGVIICGMGGSGLAGDIIHSASEELRLKVPVVTWKNYGLPKHQFRHPLYLFISFSGNTEETLSGLTELLRRHHGKWPPAHIAIITTGGKLLKLTESKKLATVSFPAGVLTPRQSIATMFYAVSETLHAAGLMPKARRFPHIDPKSHRAAGKKLAAKLKNRLIVIYTGERHRYLGYIWKIKFNETSKVQAFNDVLPEMDHNELTAFDAPSKGARFKTAALFLHRKDLTGHIAKKFRITKHLLKTRNVSVIELPFTGRTELEKVWRTIILADWTSYFLGKLNGIPLEEFNIVNPKIVIDLKRLMG